MLASISYNFVTIMPEDLNQAFLIGILVWEAITPVEFRRQRGIGRPVVWIAGHELRKPGSRYCWHRQFQLHCRYYAGEMSHSRMLCTVHRYFNPMGLLGDGTVFCATGASTAFNNSVF